MLSAVAYAGNSDADAQLAFKAAASALPELNISLHPREVAGLVQLHQALANVQLAALDARRRLIQACAAAIAADGHATLPQAELLRGVAALLDCPMPPLLPGEAIPKNGSANLSSKTGAV